MDQSGRSDIDGGSPVTQKPVSSLRSRFEVVSTTKPLPVPPTTANTPKTYKTLDVPTTSSVQSTPRQSLDIPHREHQRTLSTQSDSSSKRTPPEPPKPRRRPATPPPKARPAPILPPPTAQSSAPRVDITSPRSPPKDVPRAVPMSLGMNVPAPPSPRLQTSSGHFRIPSRSTSPNGAISLSRSPSPRGRVAGRGQGSDSVDGLPTPLAKNSTKTTMGPPPAVNRAPPPVNRAAKARVISTDLTVAPRPAEPMTSTITPPRNMPNTSLVKSTQSTSQSASISPAQPIFERPPTRHVVPAQRRQASGSMGYGLGIGGSPQRKHSDGEVNPGNKPVLPPRRELAPLPRTSVEIPARISSDIGRPSALALGLSTGSTIASPRVTSTAPPTPRGRQVSTDMFSSSQSQALVRSNQRDLDGSSRDDPSVMHGFSAEVASSEVYPDPSQANRRPPCFKDSPKSIATTYDLRMIDACGEYVCCAGAATRVWSLLTGKMIMSTPHGEGVKISAVCFKPVRKIEDEGKRLWLGTNWGEILEMDIATKKIIANNNQAHMRREVIKIFRHASELWTLDDEGKLYVWPADESGSPNLANGTLNPRLPRGHTASLVVDNNLWLATGKEIRVFRPSAVADHAQELTDYPLMQKNIGEIASVATISSQPELIYFGHSDGKISVYSRKDYTCAEVHSVSMYKVSSLVGVGGYLWAGYSGGTIFVYDTTTRPWMIKKEWRGHAMPIVDIVVDRSSIWKLDRLQVVSLGMDNMIKIWDGMLEDDWIDNEMHRNDSQFCTFKEMTSLVMTWNAGASKPADLRYDEQNSNFFRELLQTSSVPDVVVFGLQELVDLEDKKLTAKSFFKSKKQDAYGNEQLSSAYRAWRDYFSQCIEEYMPPKEPYILLHTASLVGLFTCVFVKSAHRAKIKEVHAAEVKTGMGGLHGNKGGLVVRFLLDDASLCFVNVHLAAGQDHVMNRNHDITTILETANLPIPNPAAARPESFAHGGDGAMVMDHEICIINGDLNYRIDGLPRDTVTAAIQSGDLKKLIEHDQFTQTRHRNPAFILRAFREERITFDPTYKYDVGTNRYDTSEKRRTPAWCDRILYRGTGDKIQQTEYRRHELKTSDHRPVSGRFTMRIKTIKADKRLEVRRQCEQEFLKVKRELEHEAALDYLVSVFGLSVEEARKQLQKP